MHLIRRIIIDNHIVYFVFIKKYSPIMFKVVIRIIVGLNVET